jgi:hypothetical protein
LNATQIKRAALLINGKNKPPPHTPHSYKRGTCVNFREQHRVYMNISAAAANASSSYACLRQQYYICIFIVFIETLEMTQKKRARLDMAARTHPWGKHHIVCVIICSRLFVCVLILFCGKKVDTDKFRGVASFFNTFFALFAKLVF